MDQAFFPSLSTTVETIVSMWSKVHLFMHLMVSLCRVLVSLIISLILAIPFAFLFARVLPTFFSRIEALLRVFSIINPYCLFPLFVVFFGSGEIAKISVLTWVSMWPIFFSTLAGIKNVDPLLVKTAKSMDAGPITIFFKVVLPGALPSIFNGIRIGVEMSFFILIAAEMTGATAGLGWIVHSASALNQVTMVYGAGLLIVVLGVFLNRSLNFLRSGLFFWKEERDPIAGITGPLVGAKRISNTTLAIMAAVFVAVLSIGLYEIYRAEVMLNDPTVIPEYRVWTE
ncbi:MAG: ABC transporter permease subunit [Deltaproteobacteria bacterium]|nr:ABC transporter permease subunit [Deltaproteobacteria bacterium]